ncbi:MAG TPA: glycoside hydrolase family 16 protein [Chitinophagaceae bacterium]|nr:glycoside hydrolase family 16 protein [Chitinophagaceae bacterium]
MRCTLLIPALLLFMSACSQPKEGVAAHNKLVWSEDFSGTGMPDTSRWAYETGYIRNKELQYYTARSQNARLNNGNLVITALQDSMRVGNNIFPITSASLTTRNRQSWTYGRVEVRAKIPSSLGTWPAVWMLGTNISEVGWPACGEIDIMEHVGYMPDTLHFNVHTKKYNHAIGTGKGNKIAVPSPDKDFHVYTIDWFPDHIDWYFDNKKVFTYTNEKSGTDAWPFDKPQYLILNLAFGGAWGGSRGVDKTSLPRELLIDYVKVYQ